MYRPCRQSNPFRPASRRSHDAEEHDERQQRMGGDGRSVAVVSSDGRSVSLSSGEVALSAIREVVTAELSVGDIVSWRGERRQVTEVGDTRQPAVFGSGTAWSVTLLDDLGDLVPLTAAASQRWLRL